MKATMSRHGIAILPVDSWRGGEEIYLVNPPSEGNHRYRNRPFLFTFGAYGSTRLLVWSETGENDVCDALETAAAWLAEHTPGHIMSLDDEYLTKLYNEAREELASEYSDPDELDLAAQEQATQDLTYTESGYLTSHEWHVDGPLSRAELLSLLNRKQAA